MGHLTATLLLSIFAISVEVRINVLFHGTKPMYGVILCAKTTFPPSLGSITALLSTHVRVTATATGCPCPVCHSLPVFFVLSYVYSKQPIFGLTQEWFRELYCKVHDKLHISSADWWDLLFPWPGPGPWQNIL